MSDQPGMTLLPNIRPGLLSHSLDGQVLVYDSSADRVHLLDPMTACVMDLLADGQRPEAAIIAEMTARLGVAADRDHLRLAIQALRDAELLDSADAYAESEPGFSRRDAVRHLAAAGITGMLVPAIVTLTASRAYAQGTVLGVGSACTADAQCLEGTGRCCGGLCRVAACNGNGSACGPGVVPPDTSNGRIVDCTCCSGFCQRSGNSANFSCQA
jgi:PqqD family protein of HPr-rel-A system